MNGLQVLKYSLSPIFFSNKVDKEKMCIGFVTLGIVIALIINQFPIDRTTDRRI